MDLTPENKAIIDGHNYYTLLYQWRFAPAGDPWFQGETGTYWSERMEKIKKTVDHVSISKRIGWEK